MYFIVRNHISDFVQVMELYEKPYFHPVPPRMAGTMSGYADAVAIRAMEKAMRKELESLLAAFSDGAIMEEREDAAP